MTDRSRSPSPQRRLGRVSLESDSESSDSDGNDASETSRSSSTSSSSSHVDALERARREVILVCH